MCGPNKPGGKKKAPPKGVMPTVVNEPFWPKKEEGASAPNWETAPCYQSQEIWNGDKTPPRGDPNPNVEDPKLKVITKGFKWWFKVKIRNPKAFLEPLC